MALRGTGAFLAAFLAVFVARTEGAEYSGQFFYLVSTLTIVSVVTRLGAEPYLTSRIATLDHADRDLPARVLFSTFAAVVCLVAGIGAVLWMLQLFLPGLVGQALGEAPIGLLMLAVLGLNTMWVVTGFCRALGMAGISILLETGLLSLWLLGILLACAHTSLVPDSATVALGVALMGPTLLVPLLPMLVRTGRTLFSLRGLRDAVRGVCGFGAVTVVNGVIVLIPLQALVWNGLVEEAGVYNAALRVSMFVGASGVVVKSMVVRHDTTRADRYSNRSRDIWRSLAIALPWILVSAVIAWQGQLVAALFGPDFTAIEGIILLMLVAQSINVAGFLIETRAVLANEQRLLNVTAFLTLVAALCITPALVGTFGLEGAAWSFAAVIAFSRGVMAWLYVRRARGHSSMPCDSARTSPNDDTHAGARES